MKFLIIIFGLYIQKNTNFGKLFSRFSSYNSNTYQNESLPYDYFNNNDYKHANLLDKIDKINKIDKIDKINKIDNNITGVDLRYENDINRTQNILKYSILFKKKRLLDLLNDSTIPIFYKLQLIEKYNLENDVNLLQNNKIRGSNYGEDLMREFYKK